MNYFGNLTGPAVDKGGKRKDAQELSTEVSLWMSIQNILESTNGQIGEYRPTLKNQFHIFGKRKYQISTLMMTIRFSKSSERLLLMMVLEE